MGKNLNGQLGAHTCAKSKTRAICSPTATVSSPCQRELYVNGGTAWALGVWLLSQHSGVHPRCSDAVFVLYRLTPLLLMRCWLFPGWLGF